MKKYKLSIGIEWTEKDLKDISGHKPTLEEIEEEMRECLWEIIEDIALNKTDFDSSFEVIENKEKGR